MWGGHSCPPAFDLTSDCRSEVKTRPRAAGKSARSTSFPNFSRKRTHVGAKSILFYVLSCEPRAAMVASKSTSLPLASLNRERWLAREVFRGACLRAGEAETGRRTGAKEFKSRRAKRLGWRLRERLSLAAPIVVSG